MRLGRRDSTFKSSCGFRTVKRLAKSTVDWCFKGTPSSCGIHSELEPQQAPFCPSSCILTNSATESITWICRSARVQAVLARASRRAARGERSGQAARHDGKLCNAAEGWPVGWLSSIALRSIGREQVWNKTRSSLAVGHGRIATCTCASAEFMLMLMPAS